MKYTLLLPVRRDTKQPQLAEEILLFLRMEAAQIRACLPPKPTFLID